MKKIITVVLVSVFLSAAFCGLKYPVTSTLMKDANFGLSPLISAGEAEHLFVGSSLFRQGLQLSDVKDSDAYILSYNGNQPFQTYLILEYLTENGVKLGTVYVDMYVYSISTPPSISDKRIFLDTPLGFKYNLLSETIANGNQSYDTLYEGIVRANNEMLLTWAASYPAINQRYDRGSSLPSGKVGLSKEEIEVTPIPGSINTLRLHQKQSEYVKKIVELSRENDFKVVFIETPKYTTLAQNADYQRLMRDYVNLIADYDDIEIILSAPIYDSIGCEHDPRVSGLEFGNDLPENYADLLHMSGVGRAAYSKTLFEFLGLK